MGFKFWNFWKPKIEQNDFECQWNIDYDSYAVDCLSSGHVCHVRTMLYVRFSPYINLWKMFWLIYLCCLCSLNYFRTEIHAPPGLRVGAIEPTGSGAWIPACEYDGGGVRWWTTSGIEIFVNWLTGTFKHFRKIFCGMREIPFVFTKMT